MPDINRPVDQASIINDLARRVRILESAQRAAASSFSAVNLLDDYVHPVAYGASFTANAVYGYDGVTPYVIPPVSVVGRKVLLIQSILTSNYGTAGIYKGVQVETRLQIDGATGTPFITPPIVSADHGIASTLAGVYDLNPSIPDHTIQFEWRVVASSGSIAETSLQAVTLIAVPLTLS